jgi:hypothetical protein
MKDTAKNPAVELTRQLRALAPGVTITPIPRGTTADELDELRQHTIRYGLTETQFQSLLFRLSPQQRRLFELLADEGESCTITVRNRCSIGNPSAVARELNDKLEAVGDSRRVMCNLEPHENRHGERGVLGRWRLVSVGTAANDNDAQQRTAG